MLVKRTGLLMSGAEAPCDHLVTRRDNGMNWLSHPLRRILCWSSGAPIAKPITYRDSSEPQACDVESFVALVTLIWVDLGGGISHTGDLVEVEKQQVTRAAEA